MGTALIRSGQLGVASVDGSTAVQYQVVFMRDPETDSVVAEVPTLQVADYGADVPEALERLQAMVTFHLDCLVREGKPIPTEEREEAGLYLQVKPPPDAA
jgi:predicted RNase H-like HicB family nuclease